MEASSEEETFLIFLGRIETAEAAERAVIVGAEEEEEEVAEGSGIRRCLGEEEGDVD